MKNSRCWYQTSRRNKNSNNLNTELFNGCSADDFVVVLEKMHSNAGIEGGNAQAARRTFAVKQHRQGRDLIHIAAILGHKSITTTKRLVDGDPVRLADIVARAI